LDLFEGVHHERTVGDNGFFEWRAGDQHEAHGAILSLNDDVIAISKFEHFGGVYRFTGEDSFALENVGDEGMSFWDGELPFDARSKLHVHVKRRTSDVCHGTGDIVRCSGYDADFDAILFVGGDRGGGHFLIARLGHFEVRWEVDPELEAIDVSTGSAAGHFFVHDAATGAHPLHVARTDGAFVADAVAVGGGAFEHVGDGFDATVRMVGEAAHGTFERVVEGEVVEEQEGVIKVAGLGAEGTKQTHARAFDGGLWFDCLGDGS